MAFIPKDAVGAWVPWTRTAPDITVLSDPVRQRLRRSGRDGVRLSVYVPTL